MTTSSQTCVQESSARLCIASPWPGTRPRRARCPFLVIWRLCVSLIACCSLLHSLQVLGAEIAASACGTGTARPADRVQAGAQGGCRLLPGGRWRLFSSAVRLVLASALASLAGPVLALLVRLLTAWSAWQSSGRDRHRGPALSSLMRPPSPVILACHHVSQSPVAHNLLDHVRADGCPPCAARQPAGHCPPG